MKSIGPFVIEAPLARGPTCRLDRARDRRFDRPVVLKRSLDPAEAPALERRLMRQASFPGPRVVAVHDLLEAGPEGIVGVLEMVDGVDLARWAEEQDPAATEGALVDLVRQVLRALEDLHGRGGGHGLLDPEHVLVASLEGRPFVRLTSFGTASVADPVSDLRAARRLFDLLGAPGADLVQVLARVDSGELPDCRSFREALGEHAADVRTREVRPEVAGAVVDPDPARPRSPRDETLVTLVEGARRLIAEEAYDMAGDLLREVLERQPDHTEAIEMLHVAEAIPEERDAEAPDEDPQRTALRRDLEEALEAKEPTAAATALERLIAQVGDEEDLGLWRLRLCGLWVERAEGSLEAGDLDGARADLVEAQRLAPGSEEAQRVAELVAEARDVRRTEERIRARSESLAEICHLLDGDRLREAWELHQTARSRLGSWKELEAIGAELADLLVSEAQWNAARERLDAAADLLRRATVANPTNPHARSLLAATEAALTSERQHRREGRLLQQAVSSIEEMVRREDLDGARAALAFARERFGDTEAFRNLDEQLGA